MDKEAICVEIPAEIIEEILLRLPVMSLLRLKSVCRSWSCLIGSRYFTDRHLRLESNPECLLYGIRDSYFWDSTLKMNAYDGGDERPPPHMIEPPPMPNRHIIVSLIGPVKGVFCAMSHRGLVVLSNPATREIRPLPARLPSQHYPYVWLKSLVFGFGCDPLSGDLKLVSFPQNWRKTTTNRWAYMYNLSRGDSWQSVEDTDSLKSMSYAHSSLCRTWSCSFLNGVYHWLIALVDHGGTAILGFDMRNDKFQEIVQLPDCLARREKLQITAYGELLALLSSEGWTDGEYCVDLWVRGRDGVWSKNLRIGPFEQLMLPICMRNKNEVVLQNMTTLALTLCHVSTHKLKIATTQRSPWFFLSAIYLYKESLVSTKGV